jgi:hypothetical protein
MVANKNSASSISGLAGGMGAIAITPSDTANLTTNARGLYVGTGGNISVLMEDGSTVTFKNAISGSIIPIRFVRVNATVAATAATDLVALL